MCRRGTSSPRRSTCATARVDFIVRDLRLPTATAGLAVGFALGVSGLLFQKLLGNPLASPDFVGHLVGRQHVRGVLDHPVLGAGSSMISASALAGALVSACSSICWRGVTASRATGSS